MNRHYYSCILIMLASVCFIAQSYAATSYQTYSLPITIDFSGEHQFDLYIDSDYVRNFNWNGNQSHADVTFDYDLLVRYNKDIWCADLGSADTYNFTDRFGRMLDICGSVIYSLNDSNSWQQKFSDVESQKYEFQTNWKIEEERRQTQESKVSELNNETITIKTERDQYKNQVDSCESDLNRITNVQKEYDVCKTDLEAEKKSKNTTMIISALAGYAVCYFINKKNKGGGPSEQHESGSYADAPRYRPEETNEEPRE
jgi:hypothetical protein